MVIDHDVEIKHHSGGLDYRLSCKGMVHAVARVGPYLCPKPEHPEKLACHWLFSRCQLIFTLRHGDRLGLV